MRYDFDDVVVVFGAIVTFVIISIAIGMYIGRNEIKKEAIKAGVAEYKADVDGSSIFVWKTNKVELEQQHK